VTAALYLAALLAFVVGLAHSLLGERYILRRLIRRDDLPKLFGETAFTARTLRSHGTSRRSRGGASR